MIKGFRDGIATVSKEITQTTTRTNDLADLELKMDTALIYQEQQLYNLKEGLQDTLFKIERDMKALMNDSKSCKTCSTVANPGNILRDHVKCAHGISLDACYVCASHASSQKNISSHHLTAHHLYSQHSQHYVHPRTEQGFHCSSCEIVFSDIWQFNTHLKHHHVFRPLHAISVVTIIPLRKS